MDIPSTVPFFGSFTALLAAGIAVAGVILLQILKSYRWLAASAILVSIVLITLVGFWPNGQWGISDWDYYFSYHTAVRRMVLEQGAIPQWNPYICGGTAAIGDPEFPLFAPTFLLEMIFGVPVGLRVAIFAAVSWGGLGLLALAKRLRLSPTAGLLAAIAFCLSSVSLLEIVEGHPNVFSAFYLPWIFWAWFNAYEVAGPVAALHPHIVLAKLRALRGAPSGATRSLNPPHPVIPWTLVTGIFLALTFFQGGIYMLMYVGIAFLFLILTLPHHKQALLTTLVAGLWALGFSAIKLIPVFLWLTQFQDAAYASSAYLLPSLHKILLGRYLHGSENVIPNQGGGWHEYGAYIGLVVLLLILLSLRHLRRPAVRLLWLGALVALLIASSGPLLKPLFDQAAFLPRSNISRFIILAILSGSLLAGFGLDSLTFRRRLILPSLLVILVGAATFDIAGYAAALSKQAFVLNPIPSVTLPPPPISYTNDAHVIRYQGVDYTRAYGNALAGWGTLSYCAVLGPDPTVRVVEDPEGSPYLTVPHNHGTAELVSWSPTAIHVRAALQEPGEVILNSNYARGWRVNQAPARDVYRAPGWYAGLAMTLLTLAGAIAYGLYRHFGKRPS
jgi:hypothetical protein